MNTWAEITRAWRVIKQQITLTAQAVDDNLATLGTEDDNGPTTLQRVGCVFGKKTHFRFLGRNSLGQLEFTRDCHPLCEHWAHVAVISEEHFWKGWNR